MEAQFAPARVGQRYSPRTPASQIEIFRSQMPTKKYVEIGSASACCQIETDKAVDRLRAKAAEQGGDAMIGLDFAADGRAIVTVIRYE